jgi:hypothetical protein
VPSIVCFAFVPSFLRSCAHPARGLRRAACLRSFFVLCLCLCLRPALSLGCGAFLRSFFACLPSFCAFVLCLRREGLRRVFCAFVLCLPAQDAARVLCLRRGLRLRAGCAAQAFAPTFDYLGARDYAKAFMNTCSEIGVNCVDIV